MSVLRAPVIAGNWKENHGPTAAREFFRAFLVRYAPRDDRSVVLFPPALSVAAARTALGEAGRSDILLGVQNLYWEPSGAFTGELSAPMAADAGARLALVGHSERRHLFGESPADTAKKVRAALDGGLVPVLCVGETLEERESGGAERVVEAQLDAGLSEVEEREVGHLLIAYEPVWAIGTGRTASPADAEEMHVFIRGWLTKRAGRTAEEVPILYGGSVKPDNAAALLAAREVGGLLVGGASLEAESFARICTATA